MQNPNQRELWEHPTEDPMTDLGATPPKTHKTIRVTEVKEVNIPNWTGPLEFRGYSPSRPNWQCRTLTNNRQNNRQSNNATPEWKFKYDILLYAHVSNIKFE